MAQPLTAPARIALAEPYGAVLLADWGVIRARGADATAFLQGQLTNDFALARPDDVRLAGYCSPQGRLLASFIAWRAADGDWLLACSADLLAAVLKRLSMFVLRARCHLSDASAEWPLWGLVGAPAQPAAANLAPWHAAAHGAGQILRLPDAAGQPRWLWAAPPPHPAVALPALDAARWRALEVQSGIARIVAATAGAFIPQAVNFELAGGVSFKKGCYPGQEVVARSQYRGSLKRRGALLAGAQPMQPGQEIFHSADPAQPAGRIALAAPHGAEGSHIALAEIKRAALTAGEIRLGGPGGALLTPCALPYDIALEEA